MKYSALVAAMFLMNTQAVRITEAEKVAEKAAESTKAAKMADFTDDEKINSYSIVEENFNGILGMLGTPTSMTDQLHNMFNQIHFNERVMR
jgi:hypothetical protein